MIVSTSWTGPATLGLARVFAGCSQAKDLPSVDAGGTKGSAENGGSLGNAAGSTDTKRHYTFGNCSKFVRPGYTRVEIAGAVPSNVLLSAYVGTDGTVVVVAINKGQSDATVPITIAGGTAPTAMTPWVTSAMDNLVSKADVAVTNGTFSATLGATTVTSFVGK